jgi:ABC-type multidrug transport system fused ATPase/permease subunit
MARRSGAVAAARLLVSAGGARTAAVVGVVLSGAAVSTLLVLATGVLIGAVPAAVGAGLDSPAGQHLVRAMIGFAGLAVLQVLLTSLGSGLTGVLRLRVARAVDEKVMAASLGPAGIAHLEQPAHADRIRLATGDGTRPDLLAQCLEAVLRPRLQALGLVVVLANFSWWAPAVLVGSAVLTYRQYLRVSATAHASMVDSAGVIRRSDYFRSLATDPDPAKEVRLFGLGGWAVTRMTAAWRTGMAPIWAGRRAATRTAQLATVPVVAAEALVFVALALAATRGQLSVAQVAIYAQAAIALPLLGWVGDPDYLLRQGLVGLRAMVELERSDGDRPGRASGGDRCADRERRAEPNGGSAPAGGPHRDIVLDRVRFAYPGSDRTALDGLSLRIPAGRSVAIVGANGAGKTTLIKLLARLYDPDGGRITIDGVDLRGLDPDVWRRRLAVVFQDFARYPLSLRANVALGDPGRATDRAALDDALAASGGGPLPDRLPAGWDTVLSPQLAGVDLSGGQWQRVALARALFAVPPGGVLVLDEPTANLDVRAEAELFERLLALAGGTTTILISHRLSGVRRADLIYVLDEGRVVESGTHADLMALGGRYAGMFRLQAARFLQDGDDPPPVVDAPPVLGPAPAPALAQAPAGGAEPEGQPDARRDCEAGQPDDPREPERRSLRRSLAGLRVLLVGALGESRRLAAIGLLLVPVAAALGSLQAVWLQQMVNGTAQRLLATTVTAAVLLVATRGVWRVVSLTDNVSRIAISEMVGFSFDRRLAETTASIPGLRHHESPAFLDRLHALRSGPLGMGTLLNWLINLLEELAGFAVAMVLLAALHPLLLVVPVVGVVTLRLQIAAQLLVSRSEEAVAADHRLATDLVALTTSAGAGKEIRVYRAAAELVRLQRESRLRADRVVIRAQWRAAAIGAAAGLLTTLATTVAVAGVALLATTGAVSLGAVLLAFTLASVLVEHTAGLVQATGIIARLLRNAERLHWLLEYARRAQPPPARAAVPAALRTGITFDAVSFRYPGAGAPALRDISLHLPAGSVVALVGKNGAGKTTLVKLLCGFYQPSGGRIRVDATALDELDIHRWRTGLGVAFQDFARFELLARETVGVGDLPRAADPAAVAEALERAGATGVVQALPCGMETQLGARWDGGVDLSSGQWQKLALGRALMRIRPLVLLLDEPTAALDAHTEHSLYERFTAAARAGHRAGAITVLVSHRFSTVRMADLIVVLDDGAVVESGTHAQLIAGQGWYADLYGVQAHAYH